MENRLKQFPKILDFLNTVYNKNGKATIRAWVVGLTDWKG